ncbi:MAG: Crp/Fnr family transcriptional regulator [Clostridia bacterium]|nr:Crp/Fnr family transcriptional regulator [Clostridia bacterium]
MDVRVNLDDFIKEFAENCENVQRKYYKKNQIITTYIQKRNQICVLLKGEADLVRYDFNGARSIIEHYTAGDFFGEAFYIVSVNNELSVEAKKNCEVLLFSYDNLYGDCKYDCKYGCKYHDMLKENFSKIMVDKMKALNTRIEILTKRTIREKLLGYFNILSTRKLSKSFTIPFSLTDLADYLSVDRSAMMREIKNLKDEGIIEKDGNLFTLLTF